MSDGSTRLSRSPWWRGTRGEWFVLAQILLIALVFLGPRTLPGLPPWPSSLDAASSVAGAALALAGLSLLLAGLFRLGSNLTPLPYPTARATLITTGPYRLVRHPMYTGGIGLAFGWALFVRGPLTVLYAAALLLFLEVKASWEERRLAERFPDYSSYRQRVPKLIPFTRGAGRRGTSRSGRAGGLRET